MQDNVFEIPKFKPPKISPRLVINLALVVALLVLGFNSFYQVEPEQVGVVLRFGKFVRTTEPGLQFKLPLLESVLLVPVERQLKEEFGFQTLEAGVRSRFAKKEEESLMLTGDLNVAVVEWVVQYRVQDPFSYLFKVREVTETFRGMTEATMRRVVGDRTVTEVLTVGRKEIEDNVKLSLQEMCDQYETGIKIDQVVLQDVTPPDPVKPSWDEVNQAQQQRDRLINEAQTEFNTVVPRAKGEALQQVLQAEGYSLNRINRAQGEAARFRSIREEYRKAPEVTRRRMYLETVERVLPRIGGKLMLDSQADGILPLLPLDSLGKIQRLPNTSGNGGGGQ